MYRHAFVVEPAHRERVLGAYQMFINAWLEGVDRQQNARTEAIKDYCAMQMDNLRSLAESTDVTRFTKRLFALATPAPLKAVELSARFGEIAAETQMQMVKLMGSHAQQPTAKTARSGLPSTPTVRRAKSKK